MAGQCTINSWDDLKRELKSQFFLENVEYMARRQLRDLKQTGTVQEYVKRYAALMLDICDMSEKDKMFFFLEGLKPWARTELQRQRVQKLPEALAAAKRLTDYHAEKPQNSGSPFGGVGQSNKSNKDKGGGEGNKKPSNTPSSASSRNYNASGRKKPISCFLCKGPHRIAECPQKAALNALQASTPNQGGEDEEDVGEEESHPIMGAMHFLNVLRKQVKSGKKTSGQGLMYVKRQIAGKPASNVMVDTGATHNFISEREVQKLGLQLERDSGRLKTVNSKASDTTGLVKQAEVRLGPWQGKTDFVVVPIDDFDVVLGMEFLLAHQVMPVPACSCLLFMGDNPSVVPVETKQPKGAKFLSAIQFKKGVRRQEPSFVATLIGIKESVDSGLVPVEVAKMLQDFIDVMSD